MLILPQIANAILATAIPNLPNCPALTMLYLPPHLDFASRIDQICPHPPNPHASEFTGMVVHSYRPPLDPTIGPSPISRDSGRTIIHARTRVSSEYPLLARPYGWTEPYTEAQAWEEHILKDDGSAVPLAVMSTMYAAARMKMADLSMTRDAELPRACWDVLRCWDMQQDASGKQVKSGYCPP
jgi:hypothetical protein